MKTLFTSYYILFIGGFYISGDYNHSSWANGVASAGFVEEYQTGTVGYDLTAPENIICNITSHLYFLFCCSNGI